MIGALGVFKFLLYVIQSQMCHSDTAKRFDANLKVTAVTHYSFNVHKTYLS